MGDHVNIERLWRITSSDGLAKWEVDNNCVVDVGGALYVKLPRSATGFSKLVFHKCDQVPKPLPRNYSLTASIGYTELQQQRNQRQSDDLVAQDRQNLPCLFQACAAAPKKQRTTRKHIQDMRSKPDAIEIVIDGVSVKVLRPVHPRDDLCVEMTVASVGVVVKYLQTNGFCEGNMRKHRRYLHPDVPAGAWHRRSKKGTEHYVVPTKTAEGKIKYRTFADVDELRAAVANDMTAQVESDAEANGGPGSEDADVAVEAEVADQPEVADACVASGAAEVADAGDVFGYPELALADVADACEASGSADAAEVLVSSGDEG